MPRSMQEYSNDVVVILAAQEIEAAVEERLRREIMRVDEVSWEEANVKLGEIDAYARRSLWFYKLPYRVGITAALVAGFGSIPMCFDLNTALWFNEGYVTAEVPPPSDLETWLEVGSWSWGWMEPPLGQMSFFLLTLQYVRAQMRNIGMKPYTELMHQRRARILTDRYPQYTSYIVGLYSNMTFTNSRG